MFNISGIRMPSSGIPIVGNSIESTFSTGCTLGFSFFLTGASAITIAFGGGAQDPSAPTIAELIKNSFKIL